MRAWFKLFVVITNQGKKLGIDCSKNSNESELSYSTYCGYFFILFKYIGKDSIRRHGRYPFYQKDCGHWENFIQKTSIEVFESLFYESSNKHSCKPST